MLYTIHATLSIPAGAYRRIVQVPTFFLRDDLQGISSASHAEEVARRILLAGTVEGTEAGVSAFAQPE